jgi:hypothetical protein
MQDCREVNLSGFGKRNVLRRNRGGRSGARAQPLFDGVCGTTEQLGEKVEYRGRVFENTPQGLKPGGDSIAFAARLKSCPFKTPASEGFFTRL